MRERSSAGPKTPGEAWKIAVRRDPILLPKLISIQNRLLSGKRSSHFSTQPIIKGICSARGATSMKFRYIVARKGDRNSAKKSSSSGKNGSALGMREGGR